MKYKINQVAIEKITINGSVEYKGDLYYFSALYEELISQRKLLDWNINDDDSDNKFSSQSAYPQELRDGIYEYLINEDNKNFELSFMEELIIQ